MTPVTKTPSVSGIVHSGQSRDHAAQRGQTRAIRPGGSGRHGCTATTPPGATPGSDTIPIIYGNSTTAST